MTNEIELRIARPCADTMQLEWRGLRAEICLPARLTGRQRTILLSTMMEPGGLQQACARAGVTLGMVLGERLRNPAFRRLWHRAEKERRAILETLLMDIAVRGLLPGATAPSGEAREKFLAGLAQALAAVPAETAARRGRKAAEPPATEARTARPKPEAVPDELMRLVAEVERRVSAAEADEAVAAAGISSPGC